LRHLAQTLLVVSLCAWGVSAQLAYYIDQNGKRIYVNAPPAPEPKAAAARKPVSPVRPAAQPARAARKEWSPFEPPAAAMRPAATVTAVPATPAHVEAVIQDAAKRHDVDPELVKAIVRVESNFNPRAVSHKGAMGLMQLVPGTAQRLGVSNVFSPVENVDGGVRYLKYLLGLFDGDLKLSLAAYNAGPGAVERHGGVPPYRETQNYVKKIADVYSMLRPPVPRDPRRLVRTLDANGRVLYTNLQ
jgi:soluble lytic murein transglycosylase-like protein